MIKKIALLSLTTFLVSHGFAHAAQPSVNLELVNGLTACAGRLAATKSYDGYVEGLAVTRLSSVGALEYLLGKRMDPARREAIQDFKSEFEERLVGDPANARGLVGDTYRECSRLVYDADDARKAEEDAEAAARAEAARADAEAKAQAAHIQAIELEKLRLQAAVTIESKRLDVETTKSGNDVEVEKLKAGIESGRTAASVDIAKIDAEKDVAIAGKQAEVENGRTKSSVDIAKINADTASAMVAKAAEVETVRTRAAVEVANKAAELESGKTKATVDIAKYNADANVAMVSKASEVEKSKIEAALAIADKAADVDNGRSAAAVDIANSQATAQVQIAKTVASTNMSSGKTARESAASGEFFDIASLSSVTSDDAFIANGKAVQIQGIGLGDGADVCRTQARKAEVSGSALGKSAPNSLMTTCSFGENADRTTAYYDEDGQRVVRVQRDLYLASADVDVGRLLQRIKETYGAGSSADGGTSLVYTSADGNSPRGLKVKVTRCPGGACEGATNADTVVSFNLMDFKAFANAVKSGATRLASSKSVKADAIKF